MIRLTCYAMLTDRELTTRLRRFLERLRYRVPCENLLVKEWGGGHRHVHLLVRACGEIRPELVSDLWAKFIPGPKSIRSTYCRPVQNLIGAARYIVKHVTDPTKKEVAPRTYEGRVMTYSKAFFSQSMKALWREQVREWNMRRGQKKPAETDEQRLPRQEARHSGMEETRSPERRQSFLDKAPEFPC